MNTFSDAVEEPGTAGTGTSESWSWPPPTPSSPAPVYRARAMLNVLVWKLPLPRRVLVRLSRSAYHSPPMPADVVLGVAGVLEGAGVRYWITGGWGVDALVGRATRTHHDLDLAVDAEHLDLAVRLLTDLGYAEWFSTEDPDEALGSYTAFQDNEVAGRVIDVHPAHLPDERLEFATGAIEGQDVPCMSATWQIESHSGYTPRRHHRADLGLLRALDG